ncbi:unnamed protein product [Trichogramma brassicae]|uniref:Uncharacterized protein n=1 Tax=Trichogramma brassicae TaxID=86971 RepID=A0A6H5I2N2_9HYME|nr:unnamed protein product [Trichogramma brassicae]
MNNAAGPLFKVFFQGRSDDSKEIQHTGIFLVLKPYRPVRDIAKFECAIHQVGVFQNMTRMILRFRHQFVNRFAELHNFVDHCGYRILNEIPFHQHSQQGDEIAPLDLGLGHFVSLVESDGAAHKGGRMIFIDWLENVLRVVIFGIFAINLRNGIRRHHGLVKSIHIAAIWSNHHGV